MSEFDRIARYFAPLSSGFPEALQLLDDVAIVIPKTNEQWVITTDAIAEGVHYVGDESPDLIAKKLLRSNLSDLAAKGATPKFYTLNIMLPQAIDDAWIAGFTKGLFEDQQEFSIGLIGGDSIHLKGDKACFSITAFGCIDLPEKPILRSGANIGDVVCVSGTLGDASMYLMRHLFNFRSEEAAYLESRYLLPEPRLRLGKALLGLATSAMDISDGLAQDITHIARASNVGIRLEADKIPLSAPLQRLASGNTIILETALSGGDDYELVFTLAAQHMGKVKDIAKALNVPVTLIGYVNDSKNVRIVDVDGKPLELSRSGYQH